MSRLHIVALLCISVLVGGAVSAHSARLLVCSQDENVLQVFDANTGKLITAVRTGKGPHEVAVTPDGKFAFVGDYEGVDNTVTKIDLRSYERVQAINIEPFYRPHHMVITRDGKRLFVTAEANRTIVEIDPISGELVTNYNTLALATHMLVLSPNEEFLYAANNSAANVSVIDLVRGEHERYIPAGKGAEGIDITSDGKTLWVANRLGQSISLIDTEARKRTEIIPCEGYPMRLRLTPDGKRALVTLGAKGELVAFDTETHEQVASVALGNLPLGIAVQPDGKRAYVTVAKDNQVSAVDLDKMIVVKTMETAKGPDGVAYLVK